MPAGRGPWQHIPDSAKRGFGLGGGPLACLAIHVGAEGSPMALEISPMNFIARTCESEQQHVVILVRNEGQPQLDQGNMWQSW